MSSLGAATDGLTLGGATRYPGRGAGKRVSWRDRPCIEPGELMKPHIREGAGMPIPRAAVAKVEPVAAMSPATEEVLERLAAADPPPTSHDMTFGVVEGDSPYHQLKAALAEVDRACIRATQAAQEMLAPPVDEADRKVKTLRCLADFPALDAEVAAMLNAIADDLERVSA